MGIVQKKSVRRYKRKLSAEEKLDKDLKDCMKCKYFWGNNNRCIRNKCYKEKKQVVVDKPVSECDGCPYNKGEGYCFPCMKKILGK
jgi:hypothetical protein